MSIHLHSFFHPTTEGSGVLAMSLEMKEEIFAASLEYWMNWNRTNGREWDEEDCERGVCAWCGIDQCARNGGPKCVVSATVATELRRYPEYEMR
mgnify:FL=1